jgi:hypothetical protein
VSTSNRPVLCGKCGTSSDDEQILVITAKVGYIPNTRDEAQVSCQHADCGHSVSSDSLPAALAKFEERVSQSGEVR